MTEHPSTEEVCELISSTIFESTGRSVDVQLEHRLIEEGYLDSMSIVNLILAIEGRYGVAIDIIDVSEENFGSVADLTDLICGRLTS